jgi:hypothetical protein
VFCLAATARMNKNLQNDISQILVMIMMCIYLTKTLEKMVAYWKILIFYQAIVLIKQVIWSFLVACVALEEE